MTTSKTKKSNNKPFKPLTIMKKFFYTIMFALITSLAISACADEDIKPRTGDDNSDRCQLGGPNCPNN